MKILQKTNERCRKEAYEKFDQTEDSPSMTCNVSAVLVFGANKRFRVQWLMTTLIVRLHAASSRRENIIALACFAGITMPYENKGLFVV